MYIDYDEVVERYSMLKTWAGNSPMLKNEITYAEHELNSLFASHFSVPFSGAHPTIKDIAIDLTYYRSLVIKDPNKAAKVKDAIIGRIDRIKAGDEFIITDSYTTIGADASEKGVPIWSTTIDYHPIHSMLDEENIYTKVDSSLLSFEEGERS